MYVALQMSDYIVVYCKYAVISLNHTFICSVSYFATNVSLLGQRKKKRIAKNESTNAIS